MGFPGRRDLCSTAQRVVGVRTGDRGIGKHGEQKATFEPGVDIRAKVTIFCRRRARQPRPRRCVRRLGSTSGRQPQLYAIGIKELWEVPPDRLAPGTVIHTLGYPAAAGGVRRRVHLRAARRPDRRSASSSGSTTTIRCSIRTSRSSTSSAIRSSRACSRAGSWCATARRRCPRAAGTRSRACYADGALIAGDAGGFVNSMRLKGIHLAMRTGMLAAETAFDAVRAATRRRRAAAATSALIDASAIKRELYPVRNVHQAFEHGLLAGAGVSRAVAASPAAGGSGPMPAHAGPRADARSSPSTTASDATPTCADASRSSTAS